MPKRYFNNERKEYPPIIAINRSLPNQAIKKPDTSTELFRLDEHYPQAVGDNMSDDGLDMGAK